jgi:hypothetical protein
VKTYAKFGPLDGLILSLALLFIALKVGGVIDWAWSWLFLSPIILELKNSLRGYASGNLKQALFHTATFVVWSYFGISGVVGAYRASNESGQPVSPLITPRPVSADDVDVVELAGWFVGIAGKQEGPFGISDLEQAIREGRITRETRVWREGMSEWVKIGEQQELTNLFSAVPPPLPPE